MKAEKYRFLIPGLLAPLSLFLGFVIWPYLQAMYLSLMEWRGFSPNMTFVGLRNFERLLQDEAFWNALRNSATIALVFPVLTLGISLFLASATNFGATGGRPTGEVVRGVRFAGLFRAVYFIPQILSIAVLAVLFQNVYNPTNGILNSVLDLLGLSSWKRVWLGDPAWALWAVVAVMVWSSVGFYFLILNAAMAGVPRELHEAALIDGASRGQGFWYITLPSIKQTLTVALVHSLIVAFDAFAIVQIMTVGPGGPAGATEVLTFRIYQESFTFSNFGYAAAIGVVLCLITLALALISTVASRGDAKEGARP